MLETEIFDSTPDPKKKKKTRSHWRGTATGNKKMDNDLLVLWSKTTYGRPTVHVVKPPVTVRMTRPGSSNVCGDKAALSWSMLLDTSSYIRNPRTAHGFKFTSSFA